MGEPVSSARVKLFLFQIGRDEGIPVPLVENFRADKGYGTEAIHAVGTPFATIVKNTEGGNLGWGRVHPVDDDELLRIIAPVIARWNQHQPFNALVTDILTNKPIALAIRVEPQSLQLNANSGQAVRQNYTAICEKILLGREVLEAAAR